ncbi:MAG: nicotinamide-nucleotide amidohydrolase family protein [Coriobacteriia bacterium]|nr:nicotinamide-nucleotide amidohydrolase family protein [Coriobacteriia bacterium]
MSRPATGAIVTVGTELVRGLSIDTNTAEIAHALLSAGIDVRETASVADDTSVLASILRRLTASCDLVVVTGGLGPTHDDVTRHAAAEALGIGMSRDDALVRDLRHAAARHSEPRAAEQVYRQADVLDGARVVPALIGTAPGQVVPTPRGSLVLLPGPPREMRPLLAGLLGEWGSGGAAPAIVRTHGLSESEVQIAAQDVIAGRIDIELTVLAKPGDVQAVLFDRGAGADGLTAAAEAVAKSIGDSVYSIDGASMAETVLRLARERNATIATAESCTGGMVGAALTAIPGSSDSYVGGAIAYSNSAKSILLGVDPGLIASIGAVSDGVAMAMAAGARDHLGADFAVSVTGVAGPGGGSEDRPVGMVWFAVASPSGCSATLKRFPGGRDTVRARATMTALDLLRRALIEG